MATPFFPNPLFYYYLNKAREYFSFNTTMLDRILLSHTGNIFEYRIVKAGVSNGKIVYKPFLFLHHNYRYILIWWRIEPNCVYEICLLYIKRKGHKVLRRKIRHSFMLHIRLSFPKHRILKDCYMISCIIFFSFIFLHLELQIT